MRVAISVLSFLLAVTTIGCAKYRGDLAFTVGIERDEVQVIGQDKPIPRALRVTQVFRKENGAWKLLHRHADPLLEKKSPSVKAQN